MLINNIHCCNPASPVIVRIILGDLPVSQVSFQLKQVTPVFKVEKCSVNLFQIALPFRVNTRGIGAKV
jgi:hypothetical protein